MKKSLLVIVALVVLLVLGAAIWFFSPGRGDTIDLVELFPESEKRTNLPSLSIAFDVLDVTLAGETRRAIFAHANSRITWRIRVPPNAELQTAMGLRPDVWDKEGDGVQFRIGISDGKMYDELARVIVNPIGRTEDRRWVPVTFDLSKWADQDVELVFNTEFGPFNNGGNDAAVWGTPKIVPKS